MKFNMRKMAAWVLTLIMLITSMPVSSLAAIVVDVSRSINVAQRVTRAITPGTGDVYVTFEFYNGEAKADTQVVKSDADPLQSVTAPATPPVPEGQKFMGWEIVDAQGNRSDFIPGEVTGYTTNTTVRVEATFSNVYYVYFMTVDNTVHATLEATTANQYKVTPPTDYEPAGARVDSWYTGSETSPTTFTSDTVVNADTYVYPKAVDCHWVTFNTLGGSGVSSRYVDTGSTLTLSEVAAPTRSGYAFAGWSTAEDGTAPVDTITPDKDVTLYAIWQGAPVNYTVVYWGENANDENYSALATATLQANTGTELTLTATTGALPDSVTDGQYFTFERSDTVTIAADGSSVLNVYFQRNEYTFTFQRRSGTNWQGTVTWYNGDGDDGTWTTIHTFTAKYGADISNKWAFTGSDGVTYPNSNPVVTWTPWNSSIYTKRIASLQIMPGENITWRHTTTGSTANHTFYYYGEALPGETGVTRTFEGKQYVLLFSLQNDFRIMYYSDDFLELAGFERYKVATANNSVISLTDSGYNCNNRNNFYFYYTRNSYTLKLNNYGVETSESIQYQASLADKGGTPDRPTSFGVNAEFKGWYEVEPDQITEATQPFNFTGATMPAANLVLYAYWQEPQISVEIMVEIDVSTPQRFTATIPQGTSIAESGKLTEALQYISDNAKPCSNGFTPMAAWWTSTSRCTPTPAFAPCSWATPTA